MSGRVVRRRNVKTRDRTGCVTCRARRLKCDEGKPECNNCTRLNLPCGGYARRVVFKDQTELFSQKTPQVRRTRARQETVDLDANSEQLISTGDPVALPGQQSPYPEQFTPNFSPSSLNSHKSVDSQSPTYLAGQPNSVFEAATSLTLISGSTLQTNWVSNSVHDSNSGSVPSRNEEQTQLPSVEFPSQQPGQSLSSLDELPGVSDVSLTLATPRSDNRDDSWTHASYHGIKAAPIVPQGLLKSIKFSEDMLYYHHLRDTSPYGVLSVLYLADVLDAHYLDGSFYHAALALSALKISQSDAPSHLRSQAAIHALEHFVTALGAIGKIQVEDNGAGAATLGIIHDLQKREKAVSWLSTVLFLAYFELQRGQMRLWYVHSRAAVDFISQHLSLVLTSNIGESLIRAFSRIAALLDIYDRTHSVRKRVTSSEVSNSLVHSLTTSTIPYDRLLYIMPRVNQLEEEWRANPHFDAQFEECIEALRSELEQWRDSLPAADIPHFDDELTSNETQNAEASPFEIKPFTILSSYEPVRAATNFAHYLVSLLRLDSMYPPGTSRKLASDEFTAILRNICRLAAGLPHTLCVRVNAYGHGILPALMNAYHMSDSAMADWIRKWIACLPRCREGIWNVDRVQRLLAYLDEEFSRQGSRSNWTIIKTRMADLEEDRADPLPDGNEGQSDRFCVEIYSKGIRGWSIDFVEIG